MRPLYFSRLRPKAKGVAPCRPSHRFLFRLLVCSVMFASIPAIAQSVIATIPVGISPGATAVNTATNKTYMTNLQCSAWPCSVPGTVSVIDGVTNTEDWDGECRSQPGAIAVDTATNKIYVTNQCGNDVNCQSLGTVTVIDGATLNVSTVTVGYDPGRLAVDPIRHKIFVVNMCTAPGITICTNNGPGKLTVIDGATLTHARRYGGLCSRRRGGEHPDQRDLRREHHQLQRWRRDGHRHQRSELHDTRCQYRQ